MNSRCFIFPGYGSQCVGMGKDLYDRYRVVQDRFEEASQCLGVNFVRLCFASSEKELSRPINAFPALFVVQSALCDVLCEQGIFPDLVTGWGVGYASALRAARVVSFPDGLYLLKKYVSFFEESCCGKIPASVRVVGLAVDELYDFLALEQFGGDVAVGFVCDENEHIVIGDVEKIHKFEVLVRSEAPQALLVQEPVAYGLHAFLRREIFQKLSAYLAKIDCSVPRFNILTQEGVTLKVGQKFDKRSVIRFIQGPIDIPRVMQKLDKFGSFVQVGPHKTGFFSVQKFVGDKPVVKFTQKSDLKELLHG